MYSTLLANTIPLFGFAAAAAAALAVFAAAWLAAAECITLAPNPPVGLVPNSASPAAGGGLIKLREPTPGGEAPFSPPIPPSDAPPPRERELELERRGGPIGGPVVALMNESGKSSESSVMRSLMLSRRRRSTRLCDSRRLRLFSAGSDFPPLCGECGARAPRQYWESV